MATNLNPNIDPNLPINGSTTGMTVGGLNTISSATMAPVAPITITPQATDTTNYPAVIAGSAQDLQAQATAAQATVDAQNAANLKASNDISGMQSILGGQAQDTLNLYNTNGVTASAKRLADLAAQAKNVALESNVANLNLESGASGKDVTTTFLGRQQQEVNRQAAIKTLTLSQQSNIEQGNYDAAKANSDAIISARYSQLSADLTAKQTQLQGLKDYALTPAQQKLATAQQALLAKQQSDLEDAKQNAKDNSSLALDYAKNAMASGQSDIASQITRLDVTSPSFKQDLAKLQSQIKPALTTAQKNAGITSIPTTTTTSDAGGQTAKTTGSIHNDVQAVLEGRNTLYNIRQTMGRTNAAAAYMQQMRDQITAVDPNFDFVASDAGGKSVSTSYVQKAKIAINAILPNIDKVVELSNQVNRIGVSGVDDLLQKAKVQIGNQSVTNFREAQKLIADELGVALGGGTMSDMKLQLGFDVTDPSVKPEVFASNMALVKTFLENRVDALDSLRYKSSTVGSQSSLNPNDVNYTLQSSAGADGYVSPDSWAKMENLYVQEGGTAEDFTNQYGRFKNPNNKNYAN